MSKSVMQIIDCIMTTYHTFIQCLSGVAALCGSFQRSSKFDFFPPVALGAANTSSPVKHKSCLPTMYLYAKFTQCYVAYGIMPISLALHFLIGCCNSRRFSRGLAIGGFCL